MTKKDQILASHDKLLEAMLNKDEATLRTLIHPDASVFGSAIHEYEKGLENVINYYTQALALLPDDKGIKMLSRNYTNLNDGALIEQEFEIYFELEGKDVSLLTLRQSALWAEFKKQDSDETSWALIHDHTSMPDHLGAYETISSNELLEGNLNLEIESDNLKRNLQKALSDLKIARAQLVKSEKLAAIGQLTAGIAHEIKNPLNFVNNFSEVIFELIEEAREEVRRETEDRRRVDSESEEKESPFPEGIPMGEGGSERSEQGDDAISAKNEDSALILEILDDIEANLRRIYEHGKRADSIVKSMLLLSRGKSGEAVPTNLNALLDEYLKLAYHGMRAADSDFNIELNTHFDDQMPDVHLVPQDISRAFLNIINNAMYAAYEHSKENSDHKPTIEITTHSNSSNAIVKIKDNGAGIPDEIREKIFQPFFTTKPSGVGTGLGLSMTYDIIKMHKGKLEIESEPGSFTEFIITLPITKSDIKDEVLNR